MGGIEMAASSFRAQAMRNAKAPAPSGKQGSHHKATDSRPFSSTTLRQGEAHGGKMSGKPSDKVSAMNRGK
jgi:hypothetical protein